MLDLIVGVPVVIALVGIYRASGMPKKFAPIASLMTGVVLFAAFNGTDTESLFEGLVTGLTASGLYSTGKSIVKA